MSYRNQASSASERAGWYKPGMPYLLAFHQGPTDGRLHPEAHFHIELSPALRSRDRLKFLAGTELAAEVFANDALPEEKAAEHADDPDAPAVLAWVDRARERLLAPGGRDTIGFAVVLLRRVS